MRLPSLRLLILPLIVLGLCPAARPARAADVDLKGTWKLSLLAGLQESELLLFDVKEHAGELEGQVVDSQPLRVPIKITRVTSKGDAVTVAVKLGDNEAVFSGKPSGAGAVPGVVKVNGQLIPARLEKTKADKVAGSPDVTPPLIRDYFSARNEPLPRTRARLLRAILAQKPGDPSLSPIYADVLRDAEAAELGAADVRKLVTEWVEGSKPHGDAYANVVRTKAALALAGKKVYAPLAVELAQEAESAGGAEAPLESRAELARALADAASLAGNEKLATTARARSAKLETELDAAYHKNVPPFKPLASAGPNSRKSDRVVLFELFTGAECPPCVGADVAFDALIQSYKPSQLVALQYHLHIPGPDPLTNPDTESRSEYYKDLGGTPSIYLDGKLQELPGGGMADSKDRYDSYRALIDTELQTAPGATIALKADRSGDSVKIRATAESKTGGTKLKLKLALVEEEVRYTGGNSLRFHHHVVRSMPGGPNGKLLVEGKAASEVTVDLAELRASLEKYLADFASKSSAFGRTLPPIPLARLSVVAFVQNEEDKRVLNAAVVSVGDTR